MVSRRQGGVVAGDAEQTETHHQQAGDGAAAEGDLQRRVEAGVSGLGGAHVGAHRDVHADVAGGAGQHRADDEAAGPEKQEIPHRVGTNPCALGQPGE
jgi:hypothetical protein